MVTVIALASYVQILDYGLLVIHQFGMQLELVEIS